MQHSYLFDFPLKGCSREKSWEKGWCYFSLALRCVSRKSGPAVRSTAGLWCLMLLKTVACNGVAALLLCKPGRSNQGESGSGSIFERSDGPWGGQQEDSRRWHPKPPAACCARSSPANPSANEIWHTGDDRCHDSTLPRYSGRGGGAWILISYHTCAPLLRCSKVSVWWKCWWFLRRQVMHHSAAGPQRYTLSRIMTGVMTVAHLNNCVALMYELWMDLDPM